MNQNDVLGYLLFFSQKLVQYEIKHPQQLAKLNINVIIHIFHRPIFKKSIDVFLDFGLYNLINKIIMNNLQSLRSQLLYEYSQEQFNLWRSKNFYQHHNLPTRTLLKTSQGNNTQRKTKLHFTSQKFKANPMALTQPVGRNLFKQAQKKAKLPGPGDYDAPIKRTLSHCYIKKQQDHIETKIAKRMRKRKLINQCRGPGIYNPESAFDATSKTKTASQGKILEGNFSRFIMPKTKMENLYLTSSSSQKYLHNTNLPPPNRYNPQKKMPALSNVNQLPTYKISNTQRSSIIRNDGGLPGPGAYQWDRYFQKKNKQEEKEKPKIQYKFVYGHPS